MELGRWNLGTWNSNDFGLCGFACCPHLDGVRAAVLLRHLLTLVVLVVPVPHLLTLLLISCVALLLVLGVILGHVVHVALQEGTARLGRRPPGRTWSRCPPWGHRRWNTLTRRWCCWWSGTSSGRWCCTSFHTLSCTLSRW